MTLSPFPREWPQRYKELLSERIAIMQFDAGMSEEEAKTKAVGSVREYARQGG